jgi:cell wall-associated NlpC family hydrolase
LKKIILLFSLLLLITSCKTQSNIITSKKEAKDKGIYSYDKQAISTESNDNDVMPKEANKSKKVNTTKILPEGIALDIVDFAKTNLGVSYKNGGTTKLGMDCSGLVFRSFLESNISLPRTSLTMSEYGQIITIAEAKPGDLIFFKTNRSNDINHVGLITEVQGEEIKFIHSSTSKGVIISSNFDVYYKDTFVQINRVL